MTVEVRAPSTAAERSALQDRLRSTWGELVARKGRVVDPAACTIIGAFESDRIVGLASYDIVDDECEVVAIEALEQRRGIGRALMDEIAEKARAASCRRMWLVTTNDNIPALAFYQNWGLELVAFRRDAMTEARRRLKPTIPDLGYGGIPIKHELEFELILQE